MSEWTKVVDQDKGVFWSREDDTETFSVSVWNNGGNWQLDCQEPEGQPWTIELGSMAREGEATAKADAVISTLVEELTEERDFNLHLHCTDIGIGD